VRERAVIEAAAAPERSHAPGAAAGALVLHGHSPATAEELHARAGRGEPVSRLPGDFVLASKDRIVTSVLSALPYYYWVAPDGQRLCHGASVFDVVRAARLPWTWNRRALHCLVRLGHTAGDDTLHAEVKRVPPASVLELARGRLEIRTDPFWRDLFTGAPSSEEQVLRVTQEVFDELPREAPFLSLTAGLDSRLLLALFLSRGVKPQAGTMGWPESTDVRVAEAIARRFGLEHRRVEIRPEDYARFGKTIVRLTSGSKLARHWHTYIYARRAALPHGATHFVGSNGEFARSYLCDLGIVSRLLDGMPRPLARRLAARIAGGRGPALPGDGDGGDSLLTAAGLGAVGPHLEGLWDGRLSLLDGLDALYARERVRHMIGNGLALYFANSRAVSPFLDSRWIAAVARLPRGAKLDSALHRRMILRLCPVLGDFPVATDAHPMRDHGWALRPYWARRRPPGVPYARVEATLVLEETRALLIESPHLRSWFGAGWLEAVVPCSTALADVLLTLHFVGEVLAEDRAAPSAPPPQIPPVARRAAP
jgi:asparagine synthase (glutamine-hydrolysing)